MKLLKNIDYFKIAILICSIIFLILFQDFSKNGRYQLFDENNIIDTRTGNIYHLELKEKGSLYYFYPEIPEEL